jgi:hypothetical protein
MSIIYYFILIIYVSRFCLPETILSVIPGSMHIVDHSPPINKVRWSPCAASSWTVCPALRAHWLSSLRYAHCLHD